MAKFRVALVMGSKSDIDTVQCSADILKKFGVAFETKVLSAHRTPKELVKYVEGLEKKNVELIIAYAGMAAALPGVIAAHTTLPVIGVPVETKSLKGLDSLLSIAQMPSGVPVACMSIGKSGAKNAALLALQICALTDKKVASKLKKHKRQLKVPIKKIGKIKL